jgi:predicted acylesterase/phospholipase RssA
VAVKANREFQIALAMSGAISAGAYTAGVFDFLIQALDEWENARNGPDTSTVPNHFVGIKAMSGASAGSIAAAIGAVALADADHKP